MKKLVRLGVFAGALIGLLGTMTPAHATTEASVTFTGTATTAPIGYPCTDANGPSTTNCPPAVPGPVFGYVFNSQNCVGEKVDVAKPKGTGVIGPNCSITAAGTGRGYCGLSQSGTVDPTSGNIVTPGGTATVTFRNPVTGDNKSVSVSFTFTGVGGTLVVTGTGQKTPSATPGVLTGVVQAVPVVALPGTGGSCTNGTQTDFIIAGTATYVEVTP